MEDLKEFKALTALFCFIHFVRFSQTGLTNLEGVLKYRNIF